MAREMYWPISNQKYPWLTSEEAKKLETYADMSWLTWIQLLQHQTNLYKQYISYKEEEKIRNDRVSAENQMTYMWVKSTDKKETNTMNNNVRLEQLVDIVKDKYHIPAKTDSNTVFSRVVAMAQDKWVSSNTLNKYLNDWDPTFLYEMWFAQKPVEEKTVWDNIKQWVKDVWWWLLTSFSKDFAKWWVNATAWAMDKLWVDEQTIENKKKNAMNTLDKLYNVWQDESSIAYNVADIGWDLAQLATWEWELKILGKALTKWVPFLEKIVKLWKTTDDLVKEYPIIWKALSLTTKKWTQWAADTILYNALNWEWTDAGEMWEWAVINTALWAAWKLLPSKKWLEEFAKKLEVGWLVNSKTLEAVNNELKQAGVNEFTDVRSLGDWLLKRDVKWSREEILKYLWNHADTFWKAKEELLNLSQTRIKSEAANKTVKFLEDLYWDTLWNEKIVEWLKAIENKADWSAKELTQLERKFDQATNLFDAKSELKWWATKEWLASLRNELKTQIEDIIKNEWLWDMRAINNEIQVAKTVEQWVLGKLFSEEAKDNIPKWVTHAIAQVAELVWATTAIRSLANNITKFTGMNKTSIEKLLKENWKFDDDFLKSIVPENKWQAFKDAISDIVGKAEWTTDLARTDTIVPKKTEPFKKAETTPKKEKDTSWLEKLIRQFLLTQTEELIDED